MLIPLLLAVAGLALLTMIAYGAWVAHRLTLQERMPVSGHPLQLGLHWEDVAFPSRGTRCGWPAGICPRPETSAA